MNQISHSHSECSYPDSSLDPDLRFRELLKKVGSGQHTKEDLTREEAAEATRMMLRQEATPAQIGAFMISHRIKRPTAIELAGMLDAYNELGPKFTVETIADRPIWVLGIPYDGRDRTAPVTPITALILAASGIPVVMHGGDRMPTKYGIPTIDLWQGLGIDFTKLSFVRSQELLEKTGLSFVYLPQHFPLAQGLVPYRDQIGKRPPAATLELIWSPCRGRIHQVAGYVHPPTEECFRDTFKLCGITDYTLVKGLEGSCDLPRDRTAIIVISNPNSPDGFEYLKLHPREYDLGGEEVPLNSTAELLSQLENVVLGKPSKLMPAAIWNGGFYLWRAGICHTLEAGLSQAELLLTSGEVDRQRSEIQAWMRRTSYIK
ncbi:MAG TPA: anthranilate phosphoribosyltransferase family protein [Oscillatoriales cyanobacterium M59_W2019_021]|nr:anthranilate phosphoribosyltransferase family protein [Oscillatoriales cyanobacterium M59_W2019_021]